MSTVHVMFRGSQDDFDFNILFSRERLSLIGYNSDVEINPNNVTADQIKMALAQNYDVGITEFQDHYIDINKNGNITVRANTPFGT